MRKLTEQYFENKLERAKIRTAIYAAIPANVFYHNLIIVLSEILQKMVMEMTKERVFRSAHKKEAIAQSEAEAQDVTH